MNTMIVVMTVNLRVAVLLLGVVYVAVALASGGVVCAGGLL